MMLEWEVIVTQKPAIDADGVKHGRDEDTLQILDIVKQALTSAGLVAYGEDRVWKTAAGGKRGRAYVETSIRPKVAPNSDLATLAERYSPE